MEPFRLKTFSTTRDAPRGGGYAGSRASVAIAIRRARGPGRRHIGGGQTSVPEAARVLGVNPRSLYSAIDRGECPAIRVGRLIRIPTARFREHYGLPAQPVSQHSSAA